MDGKNVCQVCGMSFKTKDEQDSHFTMVHGSQANAEMICEHCGYATRDVADMDAHKRMHPA